MLAPANDRQRLANRRFLGPDGDGQHAAHFPSGVALAWLLARRNWPGKTLVETLVSLPLVLPPVVTGLVLLQLFGQRGPLGHWLHTQFGVEMVFTWKAVVLALGAMSFPLLVLFARAAIEEVNPGAGTDRPHARRGRMARAFHGHPAAGAARHPGGRAAGLRPRARRIWRHHHGGRQHSRPHHHAAGGHLLVVSNGDDATRGRWRAFPRSSRFSPCWVAGNLQRRRK